MPLPPTVIILGKQWPTSLPGFSAREEIAAAFSTHHKDGMLLRRVYAAAVGMCSAIGQGAGANYGRAGCSVLVYGGDVYDYLREQGASVSDVAEAGVALVVPMLEDLYPREEEVAEKAGFTEAAEEAAT